MAGQSITWWHFSDVHWDIKTSTERQAFLRILYDDLRKRCSEFGSPDFVIISGDVARTGEDGQYAAFEKDFLSELRTIIGVGCPLYCVPGNHDLRRSLAKTFNPELLLGINSSRSLNEFLDDDDIVQAMNRPFRSFNAFCERVMPTEVIHGPLGWSSAMTLHGKKVLFVGLNSAWCSSYHKGKGGEADDERHLLIGQRQLQPLVENSASADLVIVITHHPLKWLNGFSETQTRQLLQRHAHLVLFGHTHALHDLSQTLGSTGSTVNLPAPAIYDRAPTDTVEFARGYNIVRFDLGQRKGAAHYFKYSAAYATKFDPFVELYSAPGQSSFPIDLAPRPAEAAQEKVPRFQTLSEVLLTYPNLAAINNHLEARLEVGSLERHAIEYFDGILMDLVRESDLVDHDVANMFWEAVVLSRGLLSCDLRQLASMGNRQYLYRHSVDHFCECLSDIPKGILLLSIDEYRRLYALSLDACSFGTSALSSISESYRRCFALPWAIGRLVCYLDYPELIPPALRTEGRIADLFSQGKPAQLAILAHRFDAKRAVLSMDLRIQEKTAFLAVTMLKHYFDIALRQAADFWRQCQRVLPPLSLQLEFPRWQNKRVDAYELTVETTPIVRLLMGRAMYRDARHVWFREILQNALDANSARRALEGSTYVSRLEIALHGASVCTIRDNGIGMSQQHILLYLTRLGRSIWNSEELTEGKPVSRDNALRAIGKFGIGFAAVFQDASRVMVRTRFFRDVGEIGWTADFSSVEKPFLLEASDVPVGTEIEIELRPDKETALTPKSFITLVNEFFVYIDDNVTITPNPRIARNLGEVTLVDTDRLGRLLFRETTTTEHFGPFTFRLRCMFGFDFKAKEKDEKPPGSFLLVSNSGVRVFQQPSLLLKPGKQYILMEESDRGTRYEDTREHGIKHFWVVLDFEKGASPILPSRLEIDIEGDFARQVLTMIHTRFSEALESVCEELSQRAAELKQRRKTILGALMLSTEEYSRYRRRNRDYPGSFCNVESIQDTAIALYARHVPILVQSADGGERYSTVQELQTAEPGIFVSESVAKSPLFRVYVKAMSLKEWVLVDGSREYFLFSKAIASLDWKGFVVEKHIYAERMQVFTEVLDSPLTDLLRGDYAVVEDQIFGKEAFIVLPSNLPNSWKRGEAASYVRRAVTATCPPRVLVNPEHPLTKSISAFAKSADSAHGTGLRELKLLLDSLSDGVIENDRVTVARERWRSIQRELRELLGGSLPEVVYETLVVRR